jgi:hypothetical protein
MPNPQPGGPGSRIYIPGDRGLPSNTPGHWVPRDRHFPYQLTWAPEGHVKRTPY